MPRSSIGKTLPGGRALYTGKNAYASQGFENDARQIKLGAMFIAYLTEDLSATGGVDTRVSWNSFASAPFSTPFLRNFSMLPDRQYFICQAGGTYRFTASTQWINLPANSAASFSLSVLRGLDELRQIQRFSNTDTVQAGNQPVILTGLMDLRVGDSISLLVNPGITASLRGFNLATSPTGGISYRPASGMWFEQIDVI